MFRPSLTRAFTRDVDAATAAETDVKEGV